MKYARCYECDTRGNIDDLKALEKCVAFIGDKYIEYICPACGDEAVSKIYEDDDEFKTELEKERYIAKIIIESDVLKV